MKCKNCECELDKYTDCVTKIITKTYRSWATVTGILDDCGEDGLVMKVSEETGGNEHLEDEDVVSYECLNCGWPLGNNELREIFK